MSRRVILHVLILIEVLWIPTIPMHISTFVRVNGQESFEYYGYVPNFNYTFGFDVIPEPTLEDPNPGWRVNGTAYLDIIGYNDSTTVTVYDIMRPEEPKIITTKTITRMELFTVRMLKNSYFKIVSDKAIAVSLAGGTTLGPTGTRLSLFYPSTDGGFAGTEFIFMAEPLGTLGEVGAQATHHTIHALEDAEITIYSSDEGKVWSKRLDANSAYSGTLFTPREVYRVVSTGRIMVTNWQGHSFTILPSVTGGYFGSKFFTKEWAIETWTSNEQVVLFITSQGGLASIRIEESTGGRLATKDLPAQQLWTVEGNDVSMNGKNVMITSTSDVMTFVANWNKTGGAGVVSLRDGMTFFAIKADQPTTFLVPARGIVFSPVANARIAAGPLELNVRRGAYATLPSGLITITSNATIIIELLTQVDPSNLLNCASYLVTPKVLSVVYPQPKPHQELPFLPIIGSIAVVVIIAVVLIIRRSGGRKGK